MTFSNRKIRVMQYDSDPKLFELPTINLMWKFSQTHPNTNILYLHTKGVSYGMVPPTVRDWTNYMLYFLVDKFNNTDLEEIGTTYDTVGLNYLDKPNPHYSGNFWWTHTNYIRMLKPIISGVRHDAEWWILSDPNVRKKIIHNSNINHYQQLYPPNLYINLIK